MVQLLLALHAWTDWTYLAAAQTGSKMSHAWNIAGKYRML
jgi:hypothetical protein